MLHRHFCITIGLNHIGPHAIAVAVDFVMLVLDRLSFKVPVGIQNDSTVRIDAA